jgi:hypothetical protein
VPKALQVHHEGGALLEKYIYKSLDDLDTVHAHERGIYRGTIDGKDPATMFNDTVLLAASVYLSSY